MTEKQEEEKLQVEELYVQNKVFQKKVDIALKAEYRTYISYRTWKFGTTAHGVQM
jgi:hypothetical protein